VNVIATRAGWCRATLDDGTEARARFRQVDGRLVIVELLLARRAGIGSPVVRGVPTGRLIAWANGPGRSELLAELATHHHDATDSQERAEAATRSEWGERDGAEEQADTLAALVAGDGAMRDDEFYRSVADAYGLAATQSAAPTVKLAEANGVTVDRARAWVREARRRGFITSRVPANA
jgi:hypothetical protein